MPQVKPEIETFAKIKVVGVGGSGNSAVNRMVEAGIRGVEFIAINTDLQALHHNLATQKLNIGKSVTRGLGAGMDPEVGRKASEESQNEIRELLKDADMVFITCGMGGGTGTGASPVVAQIARELGALTVAVVTKPFSFEGLKRREIAERGWENLARNVDTIITVPNDKINQVIESKTSMLDAFRVADDVLRQGVQGISELITLHGIINVDFADVKTIMQDTGSALMGIGVGKGENKSIDAAKAAIASPLLELSIDGANGILFTVCGGADMTMNDVEEAAKLITSSAADDAKVIFGAIVDENMQGTMKVSVIATGFDNRRQAVAEVEEEDNVLRSPLFGSAPSNFDKVKKREEEEENRKFNELLNQKKRQLTEKMDNDYASEEDNSKPEGFGFSRSSVGGGYASKQKNPIDVGFNQDVGSDEMLSDKNQDDNEELDIPAFLRKKMGM